VRILRLFATLGVLATFAGSAIPQSSAEAEHRNEIYAMALTASIAQMEKEWGSIDDSYGNRVRTDYQHLIVVQNPEITDGLPAQFGSHSMEYLGWQALIKRYKSARKEFSVLEIHPAHSDGKTLRIEVSMSWFSYQNGRASIAISDWSDVSFAFDSEKKMFVIDTVKLGGI
jgi:hypothetical protein